MAFDERFVSQTVDQFVLRDEAAAVNPDFGTLEGRTMQDVRDTIAFLAVGRRPDTVLGGLMFTQFGLFDSTYLAGNDRSPIHVGVSGNVDPIDPNSKGDKVVDILEGLVSLGFAERVFTPHSIDAALLPEDHPRKHLDKPTYKLSGNNLPPKVKARIGSVEATQAELDERQARHDAKKDLPKKGWFRGRK